MAVPSETYAVDSTLSYGTTTVNLTKNLSALYPNLNSEIDNTISINKFNDNLVKIVYRKSDKYNSLYDNSVTFSTSPVSGSSDVVRYYSRDAFTVDNVNITNALVYGANAENRVYATGYSGDASSIYNANSAANLKFIRDLDYNKILFSISAKEYSSIPVLAKGTIDYTTGTHAAPTASNVDLKDIDPDKYYMGYASNNAKIWNGSGWSDIAAHPILVCNGETIQSIQSAGTAFYSETPQYSMIRGSGQNIEISISSNSAQNFGYNFCNAMDRAKYTLGWSDSYSTIPNWADIHDTIFQEIDQHMIDNSQSSMSCTISREIINVSDSMAMLLSVVGQFYRNSTRIYSANINCMFYPLLKGSALLKILAGFGCYYRADDTLDISGLTPDTLSTSSDIWLGAMASDGTTNGTWIKGSDIDSYTGYNKDGNTVNPAFDPSGGGGSGGDEDNNDPISTTGAPFAAGLCNYYAMTAGSPLLDHISEALGSWDIANTSKDLYKNLISCKLIKPPAPIPTTGSAPFTIYGVKPQYNGADITLPVVSGNPDATFGPYQISRKFNDFRDYAPYTRVSIYLPYCGWCDLPSHVVGRSVSVHYYTDIIAATCKAVVFCGNNIIAEAAGVIGLDIPFAADNVGAKMQAVTAGMIAALGGGIQLGAGIGTMVSTKSGNGAKAALGGASQYLSGYSQMAMAFNENTTEISGKNGDGCCLAGATNIIIKIVRPKKGSYTDAPYTPPGYGHNIGYVSQKQVRVSSVSGLLIADNVDTSGISGATEAERAEIKRVLETGLIVNAAPE